LHFVAGVATSSVSIQFIALNENNNIDPLVQQQAQVEAVLAANPDGVDEEDIDFAE
jgi:hypothetical protein